jgi:GntR family transcriptional repressor for pyruvate dehydrogenase complex
MLPKIARGTLADQVTERLLEYIEGQHLKPGDLLPSESSLATSFGVSRPVVREALKNLEGKGVIEIVNGKGALVRPIDSDPLRMFFQRAMQMERSTMLELMEIRKGLEVQAVMLAAQRRDETDLRAIRQVVQAMREHMQEVDPYTRLDVDFHLRIATASHNTMMVYLIDSIRDALRSTVAAGLQSRGRDLHIEAVQRTHELLVDTLEKGDVEESMRVMTQHFDEAIAALKYPQD